MPPFMTLTWDLPDVSYSIVSHYISTTHELYLSLKGRVGSSPVRPTTAVIPGARGHDVSYSFSCTGGKMDANMFSESFFFFSLTLQKQVCKQCGKVENKQDLVKLL